VDTSVAFVSIVVVAAVYRLALFALARKGDLRAGARFGQSSFFVEVKDKRTAASGTMKGPTRVPLRHGGEDASAVRE
jgi:hypothetical protein